LNNPLENLDPSGLQPQPAPSVDIFTPTDAGFVSDVAFGSFEASANYAASGANATGTIEELANEGQLIEGAEAAHTLGTVFGAGINFYQEAKKASSEGKGALAIAARGTLGAGVSIATGVALGPLNLVDGATGGNFSESIKQAYRAPEALLGDAAAGRAYEQAVSSGSYGIVAQQANYAGTVFSEQGIGQTLDQFFGGNWVSETWEGFSDAVGARMLGPLPDVYVPPPPHPRLPPPYVSKRQTPGKFLH
jgi:hypothetical protein